MGANQNIILIKAVNTKKTKSLDRKRPDSKEVFAQVKREISI